MDNVTTTKNSFPTVDITHRPKRTQADNLKSAGVITEDEAEDKMPTRNNIPVSPTIERAIAFYEDNAQGELAPLYKSTAVWLKDLLMLKTKAPKPKVKTEVEVKDEADKDSKDKE